MVTNAADGRRDSGQHRQRHARGDEGDEVGREGLARSQWRASPMNGADTTSRADAARARMKRDRSSGRCAAGAGMARVLYHSAGVALWRSAPDLKSL